MNLRCTIYVATLFLVACSGSSGNAPARSTSLAEGDLPEGDILIYADRGARQCESDGLSPEESAQILINAGIDVLASTCGIITGVAFPAVCGGGTPDILVHQIRSVNLPDAEQLGFQEINTLVDPAAGTSYQLVEC